MKPRHDHKYIIHVCSVVIHLAAMFWCVYDCDCCITSETTQAYMKMEPNSRKSNKFNEWMKWSDITSFNYKKMMLKLNWIQHTTRHWTRLQHDIQHTREIYAPILHHSCYNCMNINSISTISMHSFPSAPSPVQCIDTCSKILPKLVKDFAFQLLLMVSCEL